MNCESQVYSKGELMQIANLQEKEAKIQILNWVLQLMNMGQPIGMVRHQICKKIEFIKAQE